MLSNIEPGVVEGTWEEIASHATEFNGRRLRVTILPDTAPASVSERLQALDSWLNLPRPAVRPLVDDSRAAIYGEDEDRG
jgi:hypothetical protein